MKTKSFLVLIAAVLVLASCEHPMRMETVVHEDGTLDKTILFERDDSIPMVHNIFGIHTNRGWKMDVTPLNPDTSKLKKVNSKPQFRTQFTKSFKSAEEANAELNTPADSLFHIRTTFEEKFRWFYTYIFYSETFTPVNRFKLASPDDYLNAEDYQFIDRLPAEGMRISKADSLYLQVLNVKIGETYANMAIFLEQQDVLKELMKRSNVPSRWFDTLKQKSSLIYENKDLKGDPEFALHIADTLGIPLDVKRAKADASELSRDLNARLQFMSFANDGKYVNVIHMPWTIVKTNADSVAGNTLVWRPLVTKFLFKDYSMYAEVRKLNVIPLVISLAVVLMTVFIWIKTR